MIDHGEAICFNRGNPNAAPDLDTIAAFSRVFYKRQANYFVFPFPLVLINAFTTAFSASYRSNSAVTAAQLLRQFHIHPARWNFFSEH